MKSASALHRLLGDEARLRLLRLLAGERLNVTELTGILGLAQSGVSRHLGLLKDAGLVAEARDGGFTYYVIAQNVARPGTPLWTLLQEEFDQAAGDDEVRGDQARLQEVLRLRKESFATHGRSGQERQLVPGRSWAAWARALGLLLPPLVVADLGCGEGYLTIETARWARQVIAVDRSAAVLTRARALAARGRVTNVRWKRGELERVPIATGTVDLVLLSQALHHAENPALALAEAARILAPGGRVLVLELRAHQERWVSERLGDRSLGFEPATLRRLLEDAGFQDLEVRVGARRRGDPFVVLIARGAVAPPVHVTAGRPSRRRTRTASASSLKGTRPS